MNTGIYRLPISACVWIGGLLAVVDLESAAILWLYGAGLVLGFGLLIRRGIL